MKKFLPFSILIFFVITIAFATYKISNKQNDNSSKSSEKANEESDVTFKKVKISLPEFSLPNLFDEQKNFSKKDLIGKYSMINFFASWCSTCHSEHKILLRLQSEKIIDIYGIAWRDIDEKTKEYLDKSSNPFAVTASDNRGLFTKIAGINAIPETWIVDPSGNVVMRYSGNLQEFSIDEIKNFIASQK